MLPLLSRPHSVQTGVYSDFKRVLINMLLGFVSGVLTIDYMELMLAGQAAKFRRILAWSRPRGLDVPFSARHPDCIVAYEAWGWT